jgi:hypothetical protein
LNNAFANTGFQFKLILDKNSDPAFSRKNRPEWLNLQDKSKEELEMKRQLRQGHYRDSNIYYTTLKEDGRAGWASVTMISLVLLFNVVSGPY